MGVIRASDGLLHLTFRRERCSWERARSVFSVRAMSFRWRDAMSRDSTARQRPCEG